MIAIPAGAALRRQLVLVVLSCLGLWVLAFLACAVIPFSTPPSFLLTDPATDTDLLDLTPSLSALDLHKRDQNWYHDTGNTVQHLLYTLAAAAVPAEALINSRSIHQNATANARLRAALQHPSDNAPAKLCQWLKHDVPAAAISPQQSVLLAGLLTSNEALMPQYILQLLEYLAAKPAESVFVSIYESGSTDRTGLWLAVLAELLSVLEVPHHIQAGGSTRQEGEDRIGFLARVRNKVLEPLWWPQNITKQQVMQPDDGQVIYSSFSGNITTTTLSSGGSSSSSSGGKSHRKQWLFRADKVVFLNDVYFCAQHVHRLLAHEGVNLACGLDHYQARTAQKLPVSWRMDVRGLQPVFLRFYDNWVARDSEGTIFRRGFNDVVRDAYGIHRMHQGLAFPVTCCWNGLAVFDAAPLQEAGLQFRSAHDDDCPASECSHFCEDLRHMGFDKMMVDPAVRLGYTFDVAAALDKGKWQTFTPWSAAQHNPPDWTQVVHKPDMMCCPEPAIQACYRRNIYERNHTSELL